MPWLLSVLRAGWKPLVLPASVLAVAGLVVGFSSRSGASVEPSHVAAPVAPAVARPSGNSPVPPRSAGPVALEPLEIRPTPNPLRGLAPAELDRLARTKPASLGSVCLGRPNRGRLFNAAPLESEPGLKLMVPRDHAFGTADTVRSLRAAAAELRAAHPGATELLVGDLSRASGGYLRPHRSHQLGIDADLGYFYRGEGKWYARATADNLERELTWDFIKALISQGSIQYIFMDRGVQALLREHALEQGEDPAWLATLFEGPSHKDTLIRHAWGHTTHFHVRFLDPAAERLGRLLEARLHPRRRGR